MHRLFRTYDHNDNVRKNTRRILKGSVMSDSTPVKRHSFNGRVLPTNDEIKVVQAESIRLLTESLNGEHSTADRQSTNTFTDTALSKVSEMINSGNDKNKENTMSNQDEFAIHVSRSLYTLLGELSTDHGLTIEDFLEQKFLGSDSVDFGTQEEEQVATEKKDAINP